MKAHLVCILSPALLLMLKKVMQSMKPSFLREDIALGNALRDAGFHPALSTHPSVVFGRRDNNPAGNTFCLSLKVLFLKKCIKIGQLRNEKGHALMRELGMQAYFGNGVAFWFVESHTPVIPYIIPDKPKPKGKIAVYTALTGGYDKVQEVLYKEDGVDYLLFTDNPSVKSETWNIICVESELDHVLLSREIKMMPHKYLGDQYETSIYIDANAVIYGELTELTRYLDEKNAFAVSRHGERKKVREEVDAVVRIKGVDKKVAEEQYRHYVEEGFHDDMGLAECNILVRRHNQQSVIELMNLWWNEFKTGVRRDQLSLIPCMQKCNFQAYAWMEGGYTRHNQFCRVIPHNQNN